MYNMFLSKITGKVVSVVCAPSSYIMIWRSNETVER